MPSRQFYIQQACLTAGMADMLDAVPTLGAANLTSWFRGRTFYGTYLPADFAAGIREEFNRLVSQ